MVIVSLLKLARSGLEDTRHYVGSPKYEHFLNFVYSQYRQLERMIYNILRSLTDMYQDHLRFVPSKRK